MDVTLAVVTRPHGLKGAVFVELRTDVPEERFEPGTVVTTSSGRELTVERGWDHSGRWVVQFREVVDRDGAEELRGEHLVISVDGSDEEDAWYPQEIAGLDVVVADGQIVGQAVTIVHLPAQDAIEVKEPQGNIALIPLVAEIVLDVDLDRGVITIDPPGGLLAEYQHPDGPAVEVKP